MKPKREKGALRVWSKLLNAIIFITALLFTVMGITDIGHDPFGVRLGFGFGIPLLLLFVYRLLRQNRQAAPAPGGEPPLKSVVLCERCGAPGRGDVCEYCGGPLKRDDRGARRRR